MDKQQSVATFVVIGLLSIGGIAIRAMGYPPAVPTMATLVLTWLWEPGLTVWWLALGGAFQSFPNDTPGLVFAIIANSVFWYVLARLGMKLVSHLAHRTNS